MAALLRLFHLQDNPPGLSRDEALNAEIANFVWQGRHALFFREGYGHEPLYHYLAAPLQPLVGDNYLAIRLPSVYIGLALVAVTIRWTRREFDAVAALTAGALVAMSWQPIIFSRVGLRPILEPLLLTAMAWFWPRNPGKAGVFLGISVYAYTAARAALFIPVLLLGWIFLTGREARTERVRQLLKPTIVMLLTALALAAPLFLTLRFDPTLQERVDQLSGPIDALLVGNFKPVLATTLATLGAFGFTGDPLSSYAIPERPLFGPFMSLLFFGGLILALRRWRQPQFALLLVWLAAALAPSAVTPDAPSMIRLIGIIPVAYILPGVAISWGWKRAVGLSNRLGPERGGLARLAVLVGITAVLGLNLARTVQDGFMQWPALPDTRLKYRSVLLDIARHWAAAGTPPLTVADSWYEPVKRDALRRDLGFDPEARWVQQGRAIVYPSEGDGRFYIPEFTPPDPKLLSAAGLTQPIFQSQSFPAFTVHELPEAPNVPSLPEPIEFGNAMTLLGVERRFSMAENQFYLISHWRVEQQLPSDLASFVHILSPDGAIVAQYDGLDAAPDTLHPGDAFIQLHLLPLPDPLPQGKHTLQIGLYTRGNGQRLMLPGELADRLILAADLRLDGE